MIINDAAILPAPLLRAASAMHQLSGLNVCIVEGTNHKQVIGERNLLDLLIEHEATQLLEDAHLNAKDAYDQSIMAFSVLALSRFVSLLYIPVALPYGFIVGPCRTDMPETFNTIVQVACAMTAQPEFPELHNKHLSLHPSASAALPAIAPSNNVLRQARPLIPYVQEQENPNIALMIRDFVVLGNATKAIEMFQKSIAHIAKPLSSRESLYKNEAAHRIGLLYSIFYKMVECSVDHKGLIQIKDKYLEQYHRSRCTQEMDLITQDMLASFSDHAQRNQQIESYTELIQKAIVYIYEHVKQKISLKDVAAGLHVNACYLSSIFKKETGKSLTLFITELKIEEAKRLLVNTAFPITTICYEIGFDNPSYFTEVFKKLVGVTPKDFKASEKPSSVNGTA